MTSKTNRTMSKILKRVSNPAGLARRYAQTGLSMFELAQNFRDDRAGWIIAIRAYRTAMRGLGNY